MKKKERKPENGELEMTEIRLVVVHPEAPRVGGDPMRAVLDALRDSQDTIVVENVRASSALDFSIPTRLRKDL